MVTLSILKLLENNGLGIIDQDLFWEKMGLGKDGLYITDIGAGQSRGTRQFTTYEIFSRGKTDVEGYRQLERVAAFLNVAFNICQLPAVPPITNYGYTNVSFSPVSTITSNGLDGNGRVIYSITGNVYFGQKIAISPPDPPNQNDYMSTETGEAILTENDKLMQF